MKSIKILVASLFLAGATFGGYEAYQAYTTSQNDLLTQNLEALADGTNTGSTDKSSSFQKCSSGGLGARECSYSIEGNISIISNGGGAKYKCSVKCDQGFYACCSFSGCTCITF